MFRRRRITVLAIILILITILILIIIKLSQAGEGKSEAKPSVPATTSTPRTSETSPSASTSAAEAKCTGADLRITAASNSSTYAANQNPSFRVTITNSSSSSCRIDVGTAAQSYTVLSDGKPVWESKTCQIAPENTPFSLAAGQIISSQPLVWHRTVSDPKTCSVDVSQRAKAPAGKYELRVSIDGIPAAESTFTLS